MTEKNRPSAEDRVPTEPSKPFTRPEVEDLGTLKVLTQQIGVTLDPISEPEEV